MFKSSPALRARTSLLALCAAALLALPNIALGATLSDSVAQALDSHPAIAAKKATVDAANANVREQRSIFFPQIDVGGRFGRESLNDDTTRAFTGGFATSWLGEGTASVTQPLFAGYANVNRYDAAKDREQAARFDLSGSADDVALRAARAHLNLMRTYDLLDIARKYMEAIQGRKNSIKLMVQEGAGDTSDLLQSEEILMAAKTTRLGYEEAFRQAEADYIAAVGVSPANVLEFGPRTWDRLIPATVDQAISSGMAASPAVKSANALVAALGKEAAADKGSLIPRLDAQLSGTDQDKKDELGGPLKDVQGVVKLTWNFATGGAQYARVDRDLSARREAAAKMEDARRTVEHDVRAKFTSMTIVDQQYDLMRDREKADEQILSNLTSQFEGGRQSNLQLINANARLFEARASRTDTYYRRMLARFELLSAMGSLREAFAVPSAVSGVHPMPVHEASIAPAPAPVAAAPLPAPQPSQSETGIVSMPIVGH
jgi:adhesin transport system outer membrane protein